MRTRNFLLSTAAVAAALVLAPASAMAGQITFVGYVTTPTCSTAAHAPVDARQAAPSQQFRSCSAYDSHSGASTASFRQSDATLTPAVAMHLAALGYRPTYRAAGVPVRVHEVVRTYQ